MKFEDKEEFKAGLGHSLDEQVRELIDAGLEEDTSYRMITMFTVRRLREEYAYRAKIEFELARLRQILVAHLALIGAMALYIAFG